MKSSLGIETASSRRAKLQGEVVKPPDSADISIGHDVLQLLSTSMYRDPMNLFREYIQNSCDAIDEAIHCGLINTESSQIEIVIDRRDRKVTIRDNGGGLRSSEFIARMCKIGASDKRGKNLRGFRGVGRLSALGMCRQLIFTTRASGEQIVNQISWDCSLLKAYFTGGQDAELVSVVQSATKISKRKATEEDLLHFFEVTLCDVVRLPDDRLISSGAIEAYLSETVPAKFSDDFPFKIHVEKALQDAGIAPCPSIVISDGRSKIKVEKSYPKSLCLKGGKESNYREIELFSIPGVDDSVAAIGWLAHHDYSGSLVNSNAPSGIRVRVGDVQIGESDLLDSVFPEARFNSWTIGEVHILDARVVPNGRRDDFESTLHWANICNHLSLLGRRVSNRCRILSIARNKIRRFDSHESRVRGFLELVRTHVLLLSLRKLWEPSVRAMLFEMERICRSKELDGSIIDRYLTLSSEFVTVCETADVIQNAEISERLIGRAEALQLLLEVNEAKASVLDMLTLLVPKFAALNANSEVPS